MVAADDVSNGGDVGLHDTARSYGVLGLTDADRLGDLVGEQSGVRDQAGEAVNLSIRAGDELVYVERKASQKTIRVEQVIGSRAPLQVTGVGKLMLGTLGEDFIRAYAERTGLLAYTEHTLPLDALLAESRQDVEQDYAFDNQEAEEGVGCISALYMTASARWPGGYPFRRP